MNVLIDDRNCYFCLKPNSTNHKFMLQTFSIGGFEQAGPDLEMNLYRHTNDRLSDPVITSRINHRSSHLFSPSSA